MESNPLRCLIRRSSKEFIDDLYYKGHVYMKTVDYFNDCEGEDFREDKYEGVVGRETISNITSVKIDGVELDANIQEINIYKKRKIFGNIYCCASVFLDDSIDNQLDIDISKFGDSFILITHPDTFIQRIISKLKEVGLDNFIISKVNYYSKHKQELTDVLSVFDKEDSYAWQKEFRIYVKNNSDEDIKLEIGSIEDIAIIGSGSKSFRLNNFKEEGNKLLLNIH